MFELGDGGRRQYANVNFPSPMSGLEDRGALHLADLRPSRAFLLKFTTISTRCCFVGLVYFSLPVRLTQFIKLNNITKASQSAVLLTHLSDESYRLVRNLVHPNKLEDCAYSELVEVLNRHFTPKRSTFADRAKFYEASRSDGESIEEWAARLRGLAVYCDFGTELDTLMRDRFVLGFRAGPERDKLFECDSKSLTFGQAVEVAQKAACARQARVIVKEEPVFRVNEQRSANPGQSQARSRGGPQEDSQRCNVCGLRFHSAEKCRFRNLKCNVCGLKGHLKKMCKAKKSNLHNIGAESDTSQGSDCRECDLFNMRRLSDVRKSLLKIF
ncbi:jg8233 [Pararge aegeria aegeria]|uniref:Jg8233 protein n=1 Tax=Pararge aegeria aegeria TaxID=348720 RepID=A0A8S4QS78_9NEOP|nr:jg8233 [Pararge aegeria aegeria]